MTSPRKQSPLPKGSKAPDFDLPAFTAGAESSNQNKNIKLSDFLGSKNVILAFYPKDDTPGCTREMCSFSADLEEFEAAQTQLLGISCDKLERHEKFAGRHSLRQPLLSDESGAVGHAYGALQEGSANASRVLFVIDKQGEIQHVVEGMPNNSELLEIVKGL